MTEGRRRRRGQPRPKVGQSDSVVCGDALEVLTGLPDGLTRTCVTSPALRGLRDHGVRPRVWRGERGCRHRRDGAAGEQGGATCRRCGAWKGCLGLEPDPDLYVEHLVAVMHEVRRPRADGAQVAARAPGRPSVGKGAAMSGRRDSAMPAFAPEVDPPLAYGLDSGLACVRRLERDLPHESADRRAAILPTSPPPREALP